MHPMHTFTRSPYGSHTHTQGPDRFHSTLNIESHAFHLQYTINRSKSKCFLSDNSISDDDEDDGYNQTPMDPIKLNSMTWNCMSPISHGPALHSYGGFGQIKRLPTDLICSDQEPLSPPEHERDGLFAEIGQPMVGRPGGESFNFAYGAGIIECYH